MAMLQEALKPILLRRMKEVRTLQLHPYKWILRPPLLIEFAKWSLKFRWSELLVRNRSGKAAGRAGFGF